MTPELSKLYHEAVRVMLYQHADWIMAVDACAKLGTDRILSPHFRQIAQRLIASGEVERADEGPLRVFYRWCGPDLGNIPAITLPPREAPAKPALENITPPRRYGNAAMPNADADYWKKHQNWGRV